MEGGSITRGETGRALFAGNVALAGEASPTRAFLALLRTGSGEVAWLRLLNGELVAPPVADEAGNFYFLLQVGGLDPAQAATFVSLDPAGTERWRAPARGDALPLAVWDGIVHQALDALIAAATGDGADDLGYGTPNAAAPLRGVAGSWAFTQEPGGNVLARPFQPDGTALPTVALFTAADLGLVTPPRWSEPLLSRRDTALISTSKPLPGGSLEPILL